MSPQSQSQEKLVNLPNMNNENDTKSDLINSQILKAINHMPLSDYDQKCLYSSDDKARVSKNNRLAN